MVETIPLCGTVVTSYSAGVTRTTLVMSDKLKLVRIDGESEGEEFSLDRNRIGIGRSNLNQIVLSDIDIGQFHARIDREEGGLVLVDLGTHSGTRVNGEEIQKRVLLPGDKIKIGKVELEVIGDNIGKTSQGEGKASKRRNLPLPKKTLLSIIFLIVVFGLVLAHLFCLIRELLNW